MNDRFEVNTIDEVDEVRKYFNRFRDEINLFHDDSVAGIEINFENYRSFNDDGRSTVGSADKTIILTVDTYPYGKEHNQFVNVEFKDVKSFEICSRSETGPTWEISHTLISDNDDGSGIEWEFGFICGGTKFLVICSKIVFCK